MSKGYLENRMDENNQMEEEQVRQLMDLFDTRPQSQKVAEYIVECQKRGERLAEAFATADRRAYQKKCREEFDAFLAMSDAVFPERQGVMDLKIEDGVSSTTVYSAIRGPIVRREFTLENLDGVRLYSDLQSRMGWADKDESYQGYCILPDKRGISKYIFASVRRKQYNGVQDGMGVLDIGEAHYSGFYRDVDGIFHKINDQTFMDREDELGSNEFFKDLHEEFGRQVRLIQKLSRENSEESEMLDNE